MYYSDDNDIDFDSEDDLNDSNSLIENINYNKTVEIVNFYKNKLVLEPTFIGINRLCEMEIINMIYTCTDNKYVTTKNKCNISIEEYNIFEDLLSELYIINSTSYLINDIANIIYYKLYI